MAALIVFSVAALICQATAQLFNAPNIGIPLLQPLSPQSLVQSDQVSVFSPQSNIFPINTCAPLANPSVSTSVVENTVANLQPLQQLSTVTPALNNFLPLNNYLSLVKPPVVSTAVVENPVAYTQPIQEVSQVSTVLPSLNNFLPLNNFLSLPNLPVSSTVVESPVATFQPLQQVSQISTALPVPPNLLSINRCQSLASPPVVSTTVVENTLANQPLQQIPQISPLLPSNPFVNPTPLIPTTVVDNSLANSLANTLQLLIVSELLGSSLSPSPSLASNIVPLYDAIGTIGTTASPVDVISSSADVTTVGYNSAVDVLTAVTDVVTSAPIAPVAQASVAAVTEVTSSIAPVSLVDVYTTLTDVSVTPVATPVVNPYYIEPAPTYVTDVTEIVSPIQVSPLTSFTEISSVQVASPLSFGLDVAAPITYATDYYSGYPDVATMPFPAEIILPQSIPAQIRCNFGYSPVNVPYLSMNVEPLAPCNGFAF